jgi:AcrR family transcriptional regulator
MQRKVREPRKIKAAVTTDRGRERAVAILEAARYTLVCGGASALSMRAVATRVGISLGNLQHYYASKEALIEALLVYMMDGYQAEISSLRETHAGSPPTERFKLVVKLLWERVQEPQTANILLEVWALSTRGGFAAELVRKVRAREHKAMLVLLRELPGAADRGALELRASMIVLVMEGLLVQLSGRGVDASQRKELVAGAMRAALRLATEPV